MFRLSVILMVLAGLFVIEPTVRGKLTFALTFFNDAKTGSSSIETPYQSTSPDRHPQERGRLPEPSTMLLVLGGLGGMLVRFVRKSFDKFKRGMDIVLSAIGLLASSPLLLLAGMLIKLDSKGPIIYQQTRVGLNGEIFRIFKLRTMRNDAEKGTGAVWAAKNDTRVTRIGKFLRLSRIDEIPQLINVLKGEMSIVGPRPERPEMVRDFKTMITDYEKRLMVKPGITGLAQVVHKYDETIDDVKKKVKYDLLYIRRMCLLTDLNILAQTVGVVLTGKGAN
jgi:exopolysaccharide biosynthesis polyprenyl glycosylphosphotransferase